MCLNRDELIIYEHCMNYIEENKGKNIIKERKKLDQHFCHLSQVDFSYVENI